MDIENLTIVEARRALDAGEYTAVELARAYLARIEEKNSELNVYLEVFDDVEERAGAADEKIAKGEAGALTGIPLAVKDNILIKGRAVSAASRILENYTAVYDAYVIEKLKEQGAVFLGRTNMDEFAMGSSTENSAFGATKNPHDTSRVPGGSSGGSAVAVAAGLALGALGSDTGGSIRQPAAFCGVVGMKPTYGHVSRRGLIAMGSSLDQIGPMARTIEDAQILYDAIRGHDPKDSTSINLKGNPKSKILNSKLKIGVPRPFLSGGIDDDVLETFERGLTALKEAGYEIVDIEMANLSHALAAYYIIMPAEASTNLSRFDGIRYGLSCEGEDVREVNEATRGEGFGVEVRRRILLGTFVLSAGYFDAYYRRALAVRERIVQDFVSAFKKVDAIALPTTPTPAFKAGEKSDPLAMYAADTFTVPVNLAGVPALSVPFGIVQRDGVQLPLGFQLVADMWAEETLFTIAKIIEGA